MADRYCAKCKKTFEFFRWGPYICEKCTTLLTVRCKLCHYVCDNNRNTMWNHLHKQCNPEVYYQCLKCGYKTAVKVSIQIHLKNKHSSGSVNGIVCLKCGRKYKNLSSFTTHKYVNCDRIINFRCTTCPFKTIYKSNLRAHLNRLLCCDRKESARQIFNLSRA